MSSTSTVSPDTGGADQVARILESITDAFFALDREWRFTYLNREAERLLRRARAELLGRSLWSEFPAAVGSPFEDEYRRAAREGTTVAFEAYYPPPLDTWYEVRAYPSPEGLSVYFRGINERKRAEAALRETEERLRLATEAADVGTWDLDPVTGVLRWDDRCKRLFGLPPDAAVDYDVFLARLHPHDRERTDAVVRRALDPDGGGEYDIEYRSLGPDGEVRWLHARGRALFAADAGERRAVRFIGTVLDITGQKRVQEELARSAAALRERERELRSLADAIPQQVWVTRADGYHEYYNRRWYEYTGTREDEVVGEGWSHLLHPDDVERTRLRWEHSLRTGEPYSIEYRFRRAADGQYRWFLGQALPQRDAAGEIVRWFGTLTDIQDQKEAEAQAGEAEEALRLSEERYRLATRATDDAIWDWDLATGQVTWNEAIHRVFGWAPEAVEPRADWWYEHLHPDDRERVVHGIHGIIKSGREVWTAEYRFRRADGSHADVLDRGYVLRDPAGEPLRMIGSMADISERARAEAAVRLSETRFRSLVEASAQAVWTTDALGLVVEEIPSWQEFTGLGPAQVRGDGWLDAVHPDDRAFTLDAWRAAVASRTPYEVEHRVRRFDGEYRVMTARAVPVLRADGEVCEWVGAHTDITLRREAERERERALEERSRFYAAMSHEIRTPINAILGYTDLILSGVYGALAPVQGDALERSQRAARHLLELVNDVLDLSKLEAGKLEVQLEPTSLPGLVEDLLATVQPLAEESGSELRLDPGSVPAVLTDPRRVRQILLNLLSNALKFGGGRPVLVRCSALPDGGARVEVVDRGIGIPAADVRRIFEEFVQLDQGAARGTGLGLSISRRLAHLLGGRLEVESREGEGSTFRLLLPPAAPGARSGERV